MSSIFQTIYNGSLSSSSPRFIRSGQFPTVHSHCQVLRVTARVSGTYTFVSDSSIDTYGYFFNHSVDPSDPSLNRVASVDNSGGNGQFLLRVNLTSGSSYVLIVTTFGGNITGSFSIRASGPSSVSLTALVPLADRAIDSRGKRIRKCMFYHGMRRSERPTVEYRATLSGFPKSLGI